jgi:hypothetical protein
MMDTKLPLCDNSVNAFKADGILANDTKLFSRKGSESGEGYAGCSAGLVKRIMPAAQIVRGLIEGYHEVFWGAADCCRFRQA